MDNYTTAGMPFAHRGRVNALIVAFIAAFFVRGVHAAPAYESPESLDSSASRYLTALAESTYPGLKATVRITPPDPRLRLLRCADLELSLPPGHFPHGTGSVGVRCTNPQPWALYLGYAITLKGPAVVAARPLTNRELIGARDVRVKEIEYSQAPTDYLRDPNQAEGLLTRAAFATDQPLLLSRLTRPLAVRAGQKVRLVAEQAGISVSQECTAMNNASEGQNVRCRVPSGRIIQGIASGPGSVAVAP